MDGQTGYRAAASWAAHIIADSQNTANDIQRILRVPAERITTVHCALHKTSFILVRTQVNSSLAGKIWCPASLCTCLQRAQLANQESGQRFASSGTTRAQSGVEFQTVVYGPETASTRWVRETAGVGSMCVASVT